MTSSLSIRDHSCFLLNTNYHKLSTNFSWIIISQHFRRKWQKTSAQYIVYIRLRPSPRMGSLPSNADWAAFWRLPENVQVVPFGHVREAIPAENRTLCEKSIQTQVYQNTDKLIFSARSAYFLKPPADWCFSAIKGRGLIHGDSLSWIIKSVSIFRQLGTAIDASAAAIFTKIK